MASEPGLQRTGSAAELLEPAWQMRWRVPELALVLSDRAAALAKRSGDLPTWLRAEGLALFAANRLGRGVVTARRALTAVREAESAGEREIAAQLRVELAWCAGSACSHEVALRVIDPVLRSQQVDPELRAHGLLVVGSCLPSPHQDEERFAALDEAERLYAQLPAVNRDLVQVLQARVHVVRAGLHRRRGDFARAVEVVDSGTRLLRRLGDPAAEGGQVHAQLTYERVQGLLELGKRSEAVANARSVLAQPLRAASAVPTGWLGLVLAARVYLPEGNTPEAVRLLNDAAATAERYQLDELLTEALGTLSRLHEREGDYPAALAALRKAYSADRRWRGAVHAARLRLLEAFPGGADRAGDAQQPVFSAAGGSPAAAGVAREPAEMPAPRQELGSDTTASAPRFPGSDPDRAVEQPSGEEPATGSWPAVSPAESTDGAAASSDAAAERTTEVEVGGFPTEDSDARPDSGADVTTILPVIAVPAEPAEEPAEQQAAAVPQQQEEQASAEPAEAEGASESSGRRSKGRSLAEIQASLQLAELPKREGRRRRRAVEDTGVTPAVEMLARHRPGWAPSVAADDAPAADQEDAQGADAEADTEPAVRPVEAEAGGDSAEELSKDAGLAELLAEAMVAYENGRRQQKQGGAESSAGGRHSQPGATSTKSSTSEEELPARHRRAAME